MNISYTSSRREVWRWYWRRWVYGNLKWVHLRVFIATSVFALVVQSTHGPITRLSVVAALIVGVLSVAWLPFVPLMKFKATQRSLSIDQAGLSTEIGQLSAHRNWSDIRRIEPAGSEIYIEGTNGNAFIIPARAFQNSEHRSRFVAALHEFHARGRSEPN